MKTKTAFLSLLAASTFFLAGCCTTHSATKWEYQQVKGVTIDKVDLLADEGWTVVGFSQYEDGGIVKSSYLLKRPKQ